jgi:hypothetical protein
MPLSCVVKDIAYRTRNDGSHGCAKSMDFCNAPGDSPSWLVAPPHDAADENCDRQSDQRRYAHGGNDGPIHERGLSRYQEQRSSRNGLG